MSLGCLSCPDRQVCGGLQVSSSLFSCRDLCRCANAKQCGYVCRCSPLYFVSRIQEIGGFGLDNVPKARPLRMRQLPLVTPFLFGGSHRQHRLTSQSVAIKLRQLIDYPCGRLKFSTRAALARHFKFDPNAQVIISGVDKDKRIEPYWSVVHRSEIIAQLCELAPDLITVPNFSMFLDVPRWDNLHNMKRIALCWSELVSRGLPTSLHLNARTDRDWDRWIEFIRARDEVSSVTVEFATGLARKARAQWHVEKLHMLASSVPRALHLTMRGGVKYLRELSRSFNTISLLDSSAFMKTTHRRLDWEPGRRGRWRTIAMAEAEPLDDLLQHNVTRLAEMRLYQIRY